MKTTIEITKEVGLHLATDVNWMPIIGLAYAEKLIALVRADEREQCARVCDELHWPWHMGDNSGPKECAAAIRARGQA